MEPSETILRDSPPPNMSSVTNNITDRGPRAVLALMTREELSEAPELAPFPTSVLSALELCDDPEAQPRDVVALVDHDPVIAARMLRLVNSSAFGLCRTVEDLTEASNYLGLEALAETALAAAYAGQHQDSGFLSSSDAEYLWSRAMAHGLAARLVAEQDSELLPSRAFLAGLLESIGLLWAFQRVPPRFLKRIGALLELGCTPHSAQALVLRCDHLQCGAELLRAWDLPPFVWQGLEDLRQPRSQARQPELHTALRRGAGLANEVLMRRDIATKDRLWTLSPAWGWWHGMPGRDAASRDPLLDDLLTRFDELSQL